MNKNASLTYDSIQKGADFIIRLHEQNIIMEVGIGEKGFNQVENTALRIKSKYGIVVSNAPLGLNQDRTAINIPLSYFLLI